MMTNREVSASPFLCCNLAGQGDLVSTQVLSSEDLGFGRTVELVSLGSFWFWWECGSLKLKDKFGFLLALSQRA